MPYARLWSKSVAEPQRSRADRPTREPTNLIDNPNTTNVAMNTNAGTIADIPVILEAHVRQVTSR